MHDGAKIRIADDPESRIEKPDRGATAGEEINFGIDRQRQNRLVAPDFAVHEIGDTAIKFDVFCFDRHAETVQSISPRHFGAQAFERSDQSAG